MQRKPILGFVHAEAAWSARSRGEEDVVVQNLLARNTFLLQKLEILHQISDSKICRITLAVVAVLFAGLKGGDVRHRQLLAAIAAALEDGANQVFVLPGETAEQNGDLVPLFGGKCALHRPVEVRGLIKAGDLAQSGTLSLQALLDFFIFFDLDKIGRHYLPPAWDFENVFWMKLATGRPPGSGGQGCSLRRKLEVAPKREQAGETSRRIRNSFELGKECRGCAPGRVTSKTNFHAPVIANCDCVLVPGVRRAFCTTCELREQRNYELHKAAGYTLESMGSLLQNPVDDPRIVVAET